MKVALITGAGRSRGIGQGAAVRLAARGFDIALSDILAEPDIRRTVETVEGLGRRCIYIRADVTSVEDSRRLVDSTIEHLGGLNAFVANAGVARWSSLIDATPEEWDAVFDVNLHGVVFGCQAAAESMRQRDGGSIVVTSSITGLMPFSPLGFYSASKHAVAQVVGVMAREWAGDRITVNHVAPGFVDSAINDQSPGRATREHQEALLDIPVQGRPVKPEEVGDAIAFLAEATMVTGTCIPVDGGLTIGKY